MVIMVRSTGVSHACEGGTGGANDGKEEWPRVVCAGVPAKDFAVIDLE